MNKKNTPILDDKQVKPEQNCSWYFFLKKDIDSTERKWTQTLFLFVLPAFPAVPAAEQPGRLYSMSKTHVVQPYHPPALLLPIV